MTALYAGHQTSFDHDHVLADLAERFDAVLEALESEGDRVINRVTPGKIILGALGGIEAGVRQLLRRRPLETVEIRLASGATLTVPTPEEALRVKAFLVVRRNRTRDYLDVVALAHRAGEPAAAATLAGIDAFYADQHGEGDGVASQVARQLAEPRPADAAATRELDAYKSLDARWHDWAAVTADPWGAVAGRVEQALSADPPYGVGTLMRDVIASARERAAREAVSAEAGAPSERGARTPRGDS